MHPDGLIRRQEKWARPETGFPANASSRCSAAGGRDGGHFLMSGELRRLKASLDCCLMKSISNSLNIYFFNFNTF